MLKKKADVFNVFKQFKATVEKITGKSIKCLRTDNGGEFTFLEFEQYCKDEGIVRHEIFVYTPQRNGIVECMNQTLMERARSMINIANLQNELWVEAISTTCYLVNRSPSVATNCKILEEVWSGQSCDYSHLRIFGCDSYALIPKNQHSKLDPKLKCYVFVRYDYAVKGYRLWDPTSRKIVISRDVKFDESSLLKSNVEIIEQEYASPNQQIQLESRPFYESRREGETSGGKGDEDTKEAVEGSEPVQQPVTLRSSTRERKTPKRYEDSVSSFALIIEDGEPSCYQEAVDDMDSEKWKMAMEEEMDSLAKNNTSDLVEIPEGRGVVGCKWVFKLKHKVD